MSLFSDRDIAAGIKWNTIGIEPFDDDQLEAASYDVRLDTEFLEFDAHSAAFIDPKAEQAMSRVTVAEGGCYILQPGRFALGSTREVVSLGHKVAARLEGKSSLGRLGLLTHATAGFIDPGFTGHITLELANVAPKPILLWPGMKIGQICFFDVLSPSRQPYGCDRNHYQGQRGPTASRSFLQFQEE